MKLFQNLFKSNRVADIGDNVLVSKHNHVNISLTILCRSLLICVGVYNIYFMGCATGAKYYSLFVFTAIIDTGYICIKRYGIDFKWFNF